MLRAFAGLSMRLQGVAQITQQRRDQAMTHRVPHRLQFGRQLARTFRSPAQWRVGPTRGRRIEQRLQIRPAGRCPCRSFACDRRRDAARDPDSTLPPTPALECPAKWSNAPSRSPVRPVQYRHAPTPEPRWRPTIAETAPSAPGRGSRTCSAGSRRPHIKGTTLLLKSTAFNLLRCLRSNGV